MKLTTALHPVLILRIEELWLHPFKSRHGIVVNYEITVSVLPISYFVTN
jgi:hypothetical protein